MSPAIITSRLVSYTNFGHGRQKKRIFQKVWEAFVVGLCVISGYGVIYWYINKPQNEPGVNLQVVQQQDGDILEEDLDDGFEIQDIKSMQMLLSKKQKSFHDNRIISYENRIRRFSNPDKVFRYFATIKTSKDCSIPDTILMTPSDFFRSITFGKIQPKGVDLERFRTFNPDKFNWNDVATEEQLFPDNSVFYKIGKFKGLLTFEDFLFLLIFTSIHQSHLKYVFQMIDQSGDNKLDVKEFRRLKKILISNYEYSSLPLSHNAPNDDGDGIQKYLFGNSNEKFITLEDFHSFFRQVRDDLYWVEFHEKSNACNKLSQRQFINLIIRYVNDLNVKILINDRLTSLNNELNSAVTFTEYMDFMHFVECLHEIREMTELYKFGIDKVKLRSLARNLHDINLSNSVLDAIFFMFDHDSNGRLDNNEFFSIFNSLRSRGVHQRTNPSRKTGFEKLMTLMNAYMYCGLYMFQRDIRNSIYYRTSSED
ncbi:hypothetical protein GJ496_011233 [Pomphorhynchus laevis]|nr:hypothetical protein GJ496_011233 [Pomphorhynchus laevis]